MTFNLSHTTLFYSQQASLQCLMSLLPVPHWVSIKVTNLMWEMKVLISLYLLLNSLASSCWETNVHFISLLSGRPPTVWLVTAGSGPHISGTQLPCRHVLTHTCTCTYTIPCTRQTGTGKQSIWTASEQKHMTTFLLSDKKNMYLQKDISAKNKSGIIFSLIPMCFRCFFLLQATRCFKEEVSKNIKGNKNSQLRREKTSF